MILMEKWRKVFEGKIPKDHYEIRLQNGEEAGLIITLYSKNHKVQIDFGLVSAVRMLDEGTALNNLFCDDQIKSLRQQKFDNTIYQITEGEFERFMREVSGDLYDCLDLKHYVVITLNYIVEVITEWEPKIVVEK